MTKNLLAFFVSGIFALTGSYAAADDWTAQTAPPPVNGSVGPFFSFGNGTGLSTIPMSVICQPSSTPPPCATGETLTYGLFGSVSSVPSVPAAAGPGSNLGVNIVGGYSDPTSPTGLSYLQGTVPLAAFARSATVDSLSLTVGNLSSTVGSQATSLNALSTSLNDVSLMVGNLSSTVGSQATALNALSTSVTGLTSSLDSLSSQVQAMSVEFDQLQAYVRNQNRTFREGVAMSLAMDGTGVLAPNEKAAISMNVGAFGGQYGIAAGVAFRAGERLTLNGGVGTGFNGGLVGGRAGARMAW